jgi:hypothetical protein
MKTPDFWRSLANDFQAVLKIYEFIASRHYYLGSTQVDSQAECRNKRPFFALERTPSYQTRTEPLKR